MINLNIMKSIDGSSTNIAPLYEYRSGPQPISMVPAVWEIYNNIHQTAAGETLNETLALQHSTVYTCVRVIAEAIGSMTLRLYRKQARGREEAVDNPMHWMLSVEPNSDMNATTLWQALAGSMALTGMAYAEILRNMAGEPVGLYPIDPRHTEPVRMPDKSLAYRTTVGASKGSTRIIAGRDCLVFPLFSFDGLTALSPIAQAKNAIGLAIAAEKFGGRFFGNGSRPSGMLTPKPGVEVNEEDATNLRLFFESMNSGENQGRIGIAPVGMDYQQFTIPPEEAQFLQTRQLSRTDIAALFRVPPSMVGDVTKQSKASAEQENLSFVIDTLRPYMVSIETEIRRKLFSTQRDLFVKFDSRERLRGDFASTMNGIATGRQWTVLTTDEAREMLDLNPMDSDVGNVVLASVNMMNAERLLDTEPIAEQPLPPGDDPGIVKSDLNLKQDTE